MKSAQINTSIKTEIIMLKKKVKTDMKLHTYYKNLLRERLNYFHQHVSQQKYNQPKPIVQNPTNSSKKKLSPNSSGHSIQKIQQFLSRPTSLTQMIEEEGKLILTIDVRQAIITLL